MADTYSCAKSATLKTTTTTNNLKKKMDKAKKEAEIKSTHLGKLESDNEPLAKDVNSLKDKRESLHALLSSLENKFKDLINEKRSLQESLDSEQIDFGAEWEEVGEVANTNPLADQDNETPTADDTFDRYKDPGTPTA
uniref:Uncharacterized protein n=1 Tax=Cannabis sativa TaxID=3483 RepID=A0A803P7R6_CANSA